MLFDGMKKGNGNGAVLRGAALMLASSLLTCIGQLLWKLSASGSLTALLGGFALYGCGALLMILALRFGELSVLHPMLGAGYALSVFLGSAFLNEPVRPEKLLGVLVIVVGLALLARGGEGKK